MKKILLPLLAAGVCASASALTVDDLNGKNVAVVFQGHDMQLSFPVAAMGGTFEKINANTLNLNNLYDGIGRQFTLDSKGNLTLQLYNGYSGPFDWGMGTDIYGVFSLCREVQAQYTYDGETALLLCWQYGMLDEEVPSTQHVSLDGDLEGWGFNHRGNAGQGPAILLEWMSKDATLYDIQCFNGFTMYSFPTNATATEYQGNMVSDMYNVDVQIDDDGNMTIKNFLNQGMSYQVNTTNLQYGINWVYGTVDKETGEVVIPIQEVAGDVDFGFLGDGSDYDSFLGDGLFFQDGPEGYWFWYMGTSYYPWQLIDHNTFDKVGGTAAPVTGTISEGAGQHEGYSRWVSNDGDCITNVKTIIDLDGAGIYASYYDDIVGGADRIVIESANESTTDVTMKVTRSNYFGGHATAVGQLASKANAEKVDHYDIYAVVGNFQSIYDGGFYEDDNIGHRDAVLVYDGSQENEKDYFFMADYDLNTGDTGNKNITYFVKANYKSETGLEPTFHAMTVANSTNDVEAIEATEAADVTAANGVITIKGTDAEATVYNAAGAVVYQGLDREIPATAGVYVVRLGNTSYKVVL